jgi:hypothetical protein
VGIAQALADVVAAFHGASVDVNGEVYYLRATTEPADIQTPIVWIPLPDIEFQFAKQRASVNWVAYLLAPNAPKQRTTTDHLGAMIDAVTGLFPFTTGELYSLTLPGGVSAQSYRLSWRSQIPIGA